MRFLSGGKRAYTGEFSHLEKWHTLQKRAAEPWIRQEIGRKTHQLLRVETLERKAKENACKIREAKKS